MNEEEGVHVDYKTVCKWSKLCWNWSTL